MVIFFLMLLTLQVRAHLDTLAIYHPRLGEFVRASTALGPLPDDAYVYLGFDEMTTQPLTATKEQVKWHQDQEGQWPITVSNLKGSPTVNIFGDNGKNRIFYKEYVLELTN